jgi:VWFA-related protein
MSVFPKRIGELIRVALCGLPLLAAGLTTAQLPSPDQLKNAPPPLPGQPGPKEPAKDHVGQEQQEASPTPQPQTKGASPVPVQQSRNGAEQVFRATTRTVLVPTTVFDRASSGYVNGLKTTDFTLFDNEKEQVISADFSYEPLSVVLVIQANSAVEGMLPKLKSIGVLLHGLVTGETGDVAVLAFDHRIRAVQDWTNDPDRLDDSLQKLTAGSSTARTIDAVLEADHMLKRHDPEGRRRRVIMLFSQGNDKGSEAKSDETLEMLQFDEVVVYAIDISKLMSGLTRSPDRYPRPAYGNIPPEAIHSPTNNTTSATEVAQNNYNGNVLNAVPLVWNSVKDLFKLPPDQAFTRMTGGRVYSFAKQGSLEQAMTDLGHELHSQYLLSYTPNNQNEPGFHKIRVEVNRPRLEIRTRPGYYWGGGVQ